LFSPRGEAAIAALMAAAPLLAFDFDGTLAPLVARPADARPSRAVSLRLRRLAARLPVAVISGRALADLRPRLGFEPAWCIGGHGAEDDGDAQTRAASAHWAQALQAARQCIQRHAAVLEAAGVTVEDKAASLALHDRLAPDLARARAVMAEVLAQLGPGFNVFTGKRVVNITAQGSPDKADALRALAARSGAGAALFVGDDVNDEPVFAAAPPSWLTVRVGREDSTSVARYAIDSQADMALLLDRLLARAPAGAGG
jgi:trehalose 6-phosphate phosphatase